MDDWIRVRGAREHNLKNIDVDIPRNRLVVITGLSGSGKSSLAFDTIFAEGQRRFVESLSAYARQFLGQFGKPDIDSIEGLSPAIAIDQKSGSRNPRSTVGTVTEIYDYLRLLFARVGHPHCPDCGRPLIKQTIQQMVDALLDLPAGSRVLLLAPLLREQKGDYQALLEEMRRQGFVRVRVNGDIYDLDADLKLEKYRPHNIDLVVDRLIIRAPDDAARETLRNRLADSIATTLRQGNGLMYVQVVDGVELLFAEQYACPVHGRVQLPALEPRDFSFNNPQGACPTCTGLAVVPEIDPDLVLPDRSRSLAAGAIVPWSRIPKSSRRYYQDLLASLAEQLHFSLETPVQDLPPAVLSTVLYGSDGDLLSLRYHVRGELREVQAPFEGVVPNLRRLLAESEDADIRELLTQFTTPQVCPACRGARLRPEVLAVSVAGRNIAELATLNVAAAREWADQLLAASDSSLSSREMLIATPILKQVGARLAFLQAVGLPYLTLDRPATTLSGGENQRVRLATQLGAGLSGVLYVLDEPSIGLHPRDQRRLLDTLLSLRDLGNTVLVVEHDEETIRAADWLIDIGPTAGENGGELIAVGPVAALENEPRSITGQFLSGKRSITLPDCRRPGSGRMLELRGAREHNLQNIDVRFPLGTFIVVTGVSGSGKSTLINDTLHARLAQLLHGARLRPGSHDALIGYEHLDKVIAVDQSPIGRTPRSNPATYSRVFDPIRNLFAQTIEARARGYDAGRFSFNVKGGRCEACGGEGLIQVEMQFLPDLFVPCEVCDGRRYNRETLEIRYRGHSIADVLDMTVAAAARFFERVPAVAERLQTLVDVGLGYVRLGQPATTLSGGEAQRIKLAAELARRSTGRTLYILDEPTTGLHLADIERLISVLQRLVDAGNTVLVIEHHLEVIKCADYLIDLGPEGGSNGGRLIAAGTPEQVAAVAASHTGHYLRPLLSQLG